VTHSDFGEPDVPLAKAFRGHPYGLS
jgi:hypothetical protein